MNSMNALTCRFAAPRRRCCFYIVALLCLTLPLPRAQAQTLTPVTNAPAFGTFFSLSRFQAPFPFNPFPELPLYAVTNGVFLYDDSNVDYQALASLRAEGAFALGGVGAMAMMSGPTPPPPGGGGGGSGGGGGVYQAPYSGAGLKITIPVVLTNGYLYTTIFDHNPALAHDIYARTNLNVTNWIYSAWGDVGQTNYYLLRANYPTNGFFRAASGLDSDGDGMPDNWESRYGLNPHNAADASADNDGDGLTNLQEFLQGTSPVSAPAFQVTVTSPRGVTP